MIDKKYKLFFKINLKLYFYFFKQYKTMPYKSNTKQQMDTFKKSMDIKKKKLKKLKDEQEVLDKDIKLEERKFKLYEFMNNNNFTEQEVIEIFELEQVEEISKEEFNDVREDIPNDDENISDNSENISDNAENISDNVENISDNAVDTSEDEYTEVSDNEGPIVSSMCDEIFDVEFSNDGQEATKQMIDRINKEQDLYIKGKKGHYSVKKNSKEIIIENHQGEPDSKYDYGLITTIHETNNSIIVQNWEKFGRNQAKRRKFDYKGKNIEEVVQMIHDILS